ncbi:MAG: anti-sigma factor domain-containing protein [Candidatus Limnocylindria bacterium]
MDHDDALEALEIAALEQGGLDRLMAGDTPTAVAVAGHVAGCPDCVATLERLRVQVPLLRDVIRTTPPADLRARTLDLVAARGIARGSRAPRAPEVAPAGPGVAPRAARATALARWGWLGGIAAAVILSVVATTALVGTRLDDELAGRDAAIAQLGAVVAATLAVTAEPDAMRVRLVATDGSATAGTLLFSPSTTELVVVATDLDAPPAGREYRCWVQRDGERQPVGRMFFGGDLAYWIGPVPALAGLTGGATFGVSLVDVAGGTLDPDPVIAGDL